MPAINDPTSPTPQFTIGDFSDAGQARPDSVAGQGLSEDSLHPRSMTSGVSVRPGDTVETRMPWSPNSSAADSLRLATPAFDAE